VRRSLVRRFICALRGSSLVDFPFALLVDLASAIPLLRNEALEVNLSILSQNVFLECALDVPDFAKRKYFDESPMLLNDFALGFVESREADKDSKLPR
jgi:hypothetical protein